MSLTRQDKIRDFLFDQGETPVQVLADAIGASLATIRRDLTELESLGLVDRMHGAARIASAAQPEAAFAHRETTKIAAKRAIANVAFQTIRPNSMIFLDASTTVLQLARRILMAQIPVTIVTNGLVVARELAQASQIELILLGGRLRRENMSTTGPGAALALNTMWFDHLFLGASAISNDGFLSSFDADEAALNNQMTQRTSQVTILADHSKLGLRAAFTVTQLNRAHRIITNARPEDELHQYAQKSGLEITIATDG